MTRATDPKHAARLLLKRAHVSSAPVDVDAIALVCGAAVSYEPFDDDLSGVLIKRKTKIVIGVNSAHSRTRQRFTIAHELGHLKLEHQGEVFVDQTMRSKSVVMKRDQTSSQATDAREIQANRFAAELLMPDNLVLDAFSRVVEKKAKVDSSELIAALASDFGVSAQAMEYRLTNLGMLMPR
jgi:Zn-dependent peptidase ImmA (M78 family)